MGRHFLFNAVPETESKVNEKAMALLNVNSEGELSSHPDFLKIVEPTTIEDIIPAIERGERLPMLSRDSVIVIEGLDSLNIIGQNKLLKLLEDVSFVNILATDKKEGIILDTILSRMEKVTVRHFADSSTLVGACEGEKGLFFSEEEISSLERVRDSIDSNKSLLETFSLKKEGDPACFWQLYGKHGLLGAYNLMSNMLYAYVAAYYGVQCKTPSKLTGNYELDALDKAIMFINASIGKLEAGTYKYTQANFFGDIYKLDSLLRGGAVYGE